MKTSSSLFLAVVFLVCGSSAARAAGHLPGNTITNEKGTTLQYTVCNDIFAIEKKLAPTCKKPRVTQTAIVGERRRLGRMMRWNERWTLDRCGADVTYLIRFDFRGSVGTYRIEPPQS